MLIIPSISYSDIFKYTDENGITCYTDAPFGKKTERVIKEKKLIEPGVTLIDSDYSHYIQKAAAKYEIEPELIHAVIKTESNGNKRAVSRKGAMGLMQLMPATANDMNVNNPFNPEDNIDGGTKYLKAMLEKFDGNLTLALAAYNAGPKTVEKYKSVPPITETKQYVNKVFSLYKGKRSYDVAAAPSEKEKLTPVYKVELEDGTILFTNSSIIKAGKLRF
jgi:hypothetical protein